MCSLLKGKEGKRRHMVAMLSDVWKKTHGEPLCFQEHLGFDKEIDRG